MAGSDDTSPLAEDVAGRDEGTPILRGRAATVIVVAVGGALGALARWALGAAFGATPGGFPTVTLGINVVGCLLMGVLVVLVAEAREAHPLVRPFLGVGVLGGFTTFSSFAVEAQQLLARGAVGTALVYLVATVVTAVVAVVVGLEVTRRVTGVRGSGA